MGPGYNARPTLSYRWFKNPSLNQLAFSKAVKIHTPFDGIANFSFVVVGIPAGFACRSKCKSVDLFFHVFLFPLYTDQFSIF
jgi:hypothetical protein